MVFSVSVICCRGQGSETARVLTTSAGARAGRPGDQECNGLVRAGGAVVAGQRGDAGAWQSGAGAGAGELTIVKGRGGAGRV